MPRDSKAGSAAATVSARSYRRVAVMREHDLQAKRDRWTGMNLLPTHGDTSNDPSFFTGGASKHATGPSYHSAESVIGGCVTVAVA
jgi:hypothetical protein